MCLCVAVLNIQGFDLTSMCARMCACATCQWLTDLKPSYSILGWTICRSAIYFCAQHRRAAKYKSSPGMNMSVWVYMHVGAPARVRKSVRWFVCASARFRMYWGLWLCVLACACQRVSACLRGVRRNRGCKRRWKWVRSNREERRLYQCLLITADNQNNDLAWRNLIHP